MCLCHTCDKVFRAFRLSESTVVCTAAVFVLGGTSLRASSEPFLALND